MTGLILKAVGGLYTVESPDGIITCKARGIFRKHGLSPCTGDRVTVENDCITKILPRRNVLIRPPLANLDKLFFVVASCEPAPNVLLLDRFLAVCEYKQIEPVLVFTKLDLTDAAFLMETYRKAGYRVYGVDYQEPACVQAIAREMQGCISAFTGNSGVGKSTLLNAIDSRLQLETGEISKKLGRGKHTTRHVELYTLENGGKIADTPGFSTFETESYAVIPPNELADCFPELREVEEPCRYGDCRHLHEPDCAIRKAVAAGEIPESRYESYVIMLEEAMKQKSWEQKK